MKDLSFPKIGMRTWKTAAAVILAALFSKYILKDTPFFACIGAIVAVERTMPDSFRISIIRNIGTMIGGILGIVFSYLTQNVVILGLGVIPLILLCNLVQKKESIVPGGIVFFAVVFLNTTQTSATYGLRRILETLLGTAIGMGVNYLFFRPQKISGQEIKPPIGSSSSLPF